jgi:hypothetical protein
MKLDITKEWFERRVALEGDHEIGAGSSVPRKGAADGQDHAPKQGEPVDPSAPTAAKDE